MRSRATRSATSARPSRWSIADSRYLAEDAAGAVEVDYEPLPAVSDARDAVKPGAPGVHADLTSNVAAFVPMSYGDVDAAFKNAPHVFEEETATCIAARR